VKKNLKILHGIFTDNGYPSRLLNKLLYNTPSGVDPGLTVKQEPTQNEERSFSNERYIALPYVPKLTNKLRTILDSDKYKITSKPVLKVEKIFTSLKDPIETLDQKEVVYRIPCKDCSEVYIGQTGRKLKNRISSHKSDIRHRPLACALAQHTHEKKHTPDFEGVNILGKVKGEKKRLFVEMVEISREPKAMNTRTDIEGLSQIYRYLLQREKKIKQDNTHITQRTTDWLRDRYQEG